MADVFTKRCGCGAILSLRESCPRCADAARARLHAQGVAYCEEARYAPEAPRGATPKQIQHAFDAIDAAREAGRKRRAEAAQDEARTQRELVGMDFGYQPIKYVKEFVGPSVTRAELDRAIAAITKPKHEPPKDNCQCSPCIVRRLDPGWEHHRGCGTACLRRNEPPPVGAEVSWEVAKADMMARPVVAVYTNTGWPKAEFHWDGELKVLPPREERFIKAEIYAPGEARWVRLA